MKNKIRCVGMLGLVFIIFVGGQLFSTVNTRNGNFYISYSDATFDSKIKHKLEITRTYNSKATYIGWFGYGWGTDYETHLTVLPDQSVAIQENGGGATSFYHDESKPGDLKAVTDGVAIIVKQATITDKLSAEVADKMKSDLLIDEQARLEAVKKYNIQTKLHPNTPLTTRAYGSDGCASTLVSLPEGYKRNTDCGLVDWFDFNGHLISRTDKDGYKVSILMQNDQRILISDSEGDSVQLDRNAEGQVIRVTKNGKKKGLVEFAYDEEQNLILSNYLTEGNFYRHDYDRHHNMTRIRYKDGSSMYVSYDPVRQFVVSVTTPTNERTIYEYFDGPKTPSQVDGYRYYTRIRKIDAQDHEITDTISYVDGHSETGEYILKNYTSTRGENTISQEKDEKGRTVRRILKSGKFVTYTYHDKSNKIATANHNDELIVKYGYSSSGDQLIHLEDSTGRVVDLDYNEKGLINRMRIKNKDDSIEDLYFKYNKRAQPIEIKSPVLGSIKVEYDGQGEITKVKSDGDHKLAIQVVSNFQVIASMVKEVED